jgi:hypothetical protein
MGNWRWLCVNDWECKSLISIAMGFSKLCQGGTNASLCFQILLNNIDASVELMSEISHFNHVSFDIFTREILPIEDSSCVLYTIPNKVILCSLNKSMCIIVTLVWRVPDLTGCICSTNWSKLSCVRLAYCVA